MLETLDLAVDLMRAMETYDLPTIRQLAPKLMAEYDAVPLLQKTNFRHQLYKRTGKWGKIMRNTILEAEPRSVDALIGQLNPESEVIEGIEYAGHTYSIEVVDGRIVRTACEGRWEMTDANIGDDRLLEVLMQKAGVKA